MNLFRKATATVALVTLVSGILSTGVSAYSNGQVTAANALAAAGYINAQADASGFNLDQNVLRQEIAKVAAGIAGVEAKTTCSNSFSDVSATTPNTWACGYAEALLDAGLVSANAKFNPESNITKAEAVKLMLSAAGFKDFYTNVATWQEETVSFAANEGIVNPFSDYNTAATRGFVFESANEAINAGSEDESLDDILGSLLGDDEDAASDDEEDASEEEDTTADEETTTTVEGSNLEVTVSPETPAAADLPNEAEGVKVLTIDLTAGDEDVKVKAINLLRKGLGASDAMDTVALFSDEGRISKTKKFNSSDDDAEINLITPLIIKAGSTESIYVKVNTKGTGVFTIALTSVDASSNVETSNVESSEFEVKSTKATILEIENDGSVSAPVIGEKEVEVFKFKMKNTGKDSAANSTHEDVTVSEITFKEDGSIDENDELANYTLSHDNNIISTVSSIDDKYITFKLDTPIVIKDGKTEKFVVKADILGGADKKVSIVLDNVLDITATSSKYGYVNYTNSLSTESISVLAGDVTITKVEPTITDIRKDKDDVILGKMTVNPNGNEIELSKVKFTVASVAGNINNALENFELYDETNGIRYDLANKANGNDVLLTDTDLGIIIEDSTTFVVRADTKDIASFDNYKFKLQLAIDSDADGDIDSDDVAFVLKETQDDVVVSDITPSTFSWKQINGQVSGATIATIVESDTNAVVSSKGIEMLKFQVSADDSSALDLSEAKVHFAVSNTKVGGKVVDTKQEVSTITIANNAVAGDIISVKLNGSTTVKYTATVGDTPTVVAAGIVAAVKADTTANDLVMAKSVAGVVTLTYRKDGARTATVSTVTAGLGSSITATDTKVAGIGSDVDNSIVNSVSLHKNDGTVLDTVSGTQLADGVATFDGFNESIAKNGKATYYVTADLVDDSNNANKHVAASLQSIDVEDEDGDDVTATNLPGFSDRDLTIKDTGTLTLAVDTTDSEVNKTKNVLGNTTSPFVASYELTATNEDVKIKDFIVYADETTNGAVDDFQKAVSEVILYANDKTTEIAREPVTGTEIKFNNVNYVLEEGNSNVYIKVITRKIGKDEAGKLSNDFTLKLRVTDAEGNASGKITQVAAADVTEANPIKDTQDTNKTYQLNASSLAFKTVPVKVSAVSFVDEASGVKRATTLNNNDNVVAIVAITADSSTNTDGTDGSSLETILDQLKLKQSRLEGTDQTLVTAYTIENIDGSEGEQNIVAADTPKDAITINSTAKVTITAKTFGDTDYEIKITDAATIAKDCTEPVVNGNIISLDCDIAGATANASSTELKAALDKTGLFDVTINTAGDLDAGFGATHVLVGATDYITFDVNSIFTSGDEKIDNGSTEYYAIRATVTKDGTNDNDDYIKLEMDNLSASNVVYKSDDSSGNNNGAISDLRIGQTSIAGTQINE